MKFLIFVVCTSAVIQWAQADVFLRAGDRITIEANQRQTIFCEANTSSKKMNICDCGDGPGYNSVGQAIGSNGTELSNQCKAIYSSYRPYNCKSVMLPDANSQFVCDCGNGPGYNSAGQAIGREGSEIAKQCSDIQASYRPYNCKVN